MTAVGKSCPIEREREAHERAPEILARDLTLPCCDLALALQRERNRSQQALIAWQQRVGHREDGLSAHDHRSQACSVG
jgi:hypothetical protein